LHAKRKVVEILPFDHEEDRHAHLVAARALKKGLSGVALTHVVEIPVDNEASKRRVRVHQC
jgi:hypothetical protein